MMNLDHDPFINITYFRSLYDKADGMKYKMPWSKLVSTLSKPKLGARKGSAGGFVGGEVNGPRNNANTAFRNILTFDIDTVPADFDIIDHLDGAFKNAYCIYSSHNHKPENQKYRLLIPLSQNLMPDKYKQFQNMMIQLLHFENEQYSDKTDIPLVDNASTILSQHMHMPTVPDSGEHYFFHYRDAEILNPEPLLQYSLKFSNQSKKTTMNSMDYWLSLLEGVGEGKRNTSATSLCGHLLRKYVDPELVYAILKLWNDRNHPPLDDAELNKTFNSILEKEIRRREPQSMIIKS